MSIQNKFKALCIVLLIALPVTGYSMKVSFFLGEATVTRDGKSAAIKSGDLIKEGDIIKTGKGGIVEVLYDDKSKITIQQNTVVQMGSKNVKGSSDLTVIAGEIKGKFGKLKKGVHKINSPTTVCAVRGTEFTVCVSEGGDSLVSLKEGSLDIDNAYGEVKLEEGQSVEANLGEEAEVSNETVDSDEWKNEMNEDVSENIDDRADKYNRHFDRFGQNNEKSSAELKDLSEKTRKASSKDDLEKSGMAIVEAEDDLENDMYMSEASRLSVENLMQDYEGTEQYSDLEKAAEKGNAVMEQQKKNYEALQKVKQEYKDAYDRIMKKYKEDKTKIFKNLDDYKKSLYEKKDEQ